MTTIAITGATGYLGSRVAQKLSEQGINTRLIARTPTKAPELSNSETVQASYQDFDSMKAALEAVDGVLFVSSNELSGRLEAHKTVIDACVESNVKRVVYTSFLGAGPEAVFTLSADHWGTESYLIEKGVDFTALRNSFYCEIVLEMVESGVIKGPAGQGKLAPVARDDVIDTAAGALIADDLPTGALNVTGPKALTLREIAKIYSDVTGKSARYEPETVEQAYASRAHFDVSDATKAAWVTTYEAIAVGELSAVTDVVERLSGHPPTSFDEFLRKKYKIYS